MQPPLENPDYNIEALPVNDDNLERIRADWQQLTDNCPHSYFLSWGWMESWLSSQQNRANLRCIFGYQGNVLCFGFFVGTRNYRKFGIFPTRAAHLNATGVSELDLITIEYNSILATAQGPAIIPDVLDAAPLRDYNEFVFPGTTPDFADTIRKHSKPFFFIANEQLSYHTDLSRIREADGDCVRLLSRNKRQQIRRSMREYEKGGSIQHRQAESPREALEMFEQMGSLHSKTWTRRGRPGSFANKNWVHFHQTLIRKRFDSGEIYIGQFFTPSTTLGFIYGFIYENSFLFCQCGFNYQQSNNLRPGMVSHVLLIEHFAAQGLDVYDFLAGESEYKRSLSTKCTSVYWLALQRRTMRFRLAMNLKRVALAVLRPKQALEAN